MTDTQPAFKKPRVSEDTKEDEEEDLGDSDSTESGTDKPGAEGEEEPFRANDMIDLIFIEPDEQEYLASVPQYTHQVSSFPTTPSHV